MKNLNKIFKKLLLTTILILIITNIANADAIDINLTIRNGDTIIFSDTIPLAPAGDIELNSHSLNANSVLSIINDADILSDTFNISDLQYYDSFSSFYLKCITSSAGNNCDNWQYTVDNIYPGIGMDQKILSGGENLYLYFGPQYKILIDSNSITTNDALKITTQEYDYENDNWKIRTGITIGLTQNNPDDPWSPIEIETKSVNENGEAIFSSINEGPYNVGVKEDSYFPTEALIVTMANGGGTVGGGSPSMSIPTEPIPEIKTVFDIEKAFNFLISQQKEDGSFGEELYTDWSAIALASGNHQDSTIKLIKYFVESKITGTLLTDYERHAMALMSLGLNPYNTNNENYIKKITDNFDGEQFGNKEEINDDIFALIVLQNVGFTTEEEIIKKTISYILSKQKEDGSWDESVDMTGAAMEALTSFAKENFLLQDVSQADEPRGSAGIAMPDSDPEKEEFSIAKIKNALKKAKEYLKQKQKEDGGWGNISSTAWALEGILALSEKPEEWTPARNTFSTADAGGKEDNSPLDYLAENQGEDGGIKNEYLQNKIWETAYIIKALSGKTWNQIMQKFEKPRPASNAFSIANVGGEEIKKPIVAKKVQDLREMLPESSLKQTGKTKEIIKNLKKEIEIKKLNDENTASIINSLEKTENPIIKKSWFRNFLNKIFNIFQ